MRKIDRGIEPPEILLFLLDCLKGKLSKSWESFAKSEYYNEVILTVHGRFSGLCSYCERAVDKGNAGSIEHFRPRRPSNGSQQRYFGDCLTFEWSNWLFACSKCQQAKGNRWPGTKYNGEDNVNKKLFSISDQEGWIYSAPSIDDGYLDPSEERDDGVSLFSFDKDGGMVVNPNLDDKLRSKARRTICELELDSDTLAEERRLHFYRVYFKAIEGRPKSYRNRKIEIYFNSEFKYCERKEVQQERREEQLSHAKIPRVQFVSFMDAAKEWIPKQTGRQGRASGGRSRGPRGSQG